MKLKRLFAVLALATVGGLASAIGIEKSAEKPAEVAEAATPASYAQVYRFSVPNSFGSDVGNHIYLHAWGSNTEDKNTSWGSFITLSDYSYNENSERVYTYLSTVDDYTGFIIIKYYDNPNYCKSADIAVGSDTAWSWNGADGASASAWTPVDQTYYVYDYKNLFGGNAQCYAWQSGGSLNNGAYPGVAMSKVQYGSGQLYSISLDPAFDKFKVGIGDSANTGDQWINQNRGECFCWWDVGDSSWNADLDWVRAHDWVYNTMHVRDILPSDKSDTGACRGVNGYYSKAKTAYLNFSAAIKTKISEDSNKDIAFARLTDWAIANSETFNSASGTFSAVHPTVTDESSSITAMPIVIVMTLTVGSVAGIFFLRKKRKI